MKSCKGCEEKQKRIDQLENANRLMAKSADELEQRLDAIKSQRDRFTVVRKARAATNNNEK